MWGPLTRTWCLMGTGPTSSWCCWKCPVARGQLQLPRQSGAPPEAPLGHIPDPIVRGVWERHWGSWEGD